MSDSLPEPSKSRRKARYSDGRDEHWRQNAGAASPPHKRARGLSPVRSSDDRRSRRAETIDHEDDRGDANARVRPQDVEADRHRRQPIAMSPERMDTDQPSSSPQGDGSGLVELGVDEMNALRAKLGLKPLDPSPAPSSSTSTADDALSTTERLRLAKERRMERERARAQRAHAEEKPFTLGDESDEGESTSSWIEKHKRIVEEKKRADIIAKQLEEAEQAAIEQVDAAASFEGMKVVHDADELGADTVLVIRDKGVLDKDDGDELENQNLVDLQKAKKLQEKKKKKSKYDKFDEDGNPKGILSQYDEEENDEKERKSKGFVMGKSSASTTHKTGTSSTSRSKPTISIMDVDEEPSTTEKLDIFGETVKFGSRPTLSSDFDTSTTEEVTFGTKKLGNGANKTKKLRKRQTEDNEDSLGGSALDDLTPVISSHFASRTDRARLVMEEEDRAMADRQRNFAKYQNALKSASERSSAVFGKEDSSSSNGTSSVIHRSRGESTAAQLRQAYQRKSEEDETVLPMGSDLVFSNLTNFNIQAEEWTGGAVEVKREEEPERVAIKEERGEEAMDIDDDERGAALDLQKSAPSRVRVKKEEEEDTSHNAPGDADASDETRVIQANASRLKKSRVKKAAGLAQDDEVEEERARMHDSEEQEVKQEEDMAQFVPTEEGEVKSHKVHQGLGSILQLLAQRGGSMETEILAGRDKDRRLQEMMTGGLQTTSARFGSEHKQGKVQEYYREVEIERKDEYGRDLTARQAFKEFSSAFSGRKSGKRKQELKYTKAKAQMEQQRALTDNGVVASLSSLQSAQKRAATPGIVLSTQSILSRGSGVQDVVLGDTLKTTTGTASVAPGTASARPPK